MSNNLYEEAINAADQIKEAAESRVKQQLVEAMSPKIKKLIETKLLEQEASNEEEVPGKEEKQGSTENEESHDQSNKEEVSGKEEADSEDSEYGAVEISVESVQILKKMMNQSYQKNAVNEKLESIREGINHLKKAIIIAESSDKTNKFKKKFIYAFQNLLQELKNIESSSIIKTDKTLLKEYLQLSKELNNMTRRRTSKSRYLNESLEDLLEMNLFEEEEGEDSEDSEEESDVVDLDQELGGDDEDSEDSEGGMMVPDEVADMSLRELVAAVEGSSDKESDEEEVDLEGIFLEVDGMEGDHEGEEGLETVEEMESYGQEMKKMKEEDEEGSCEGEEGLETVEEGLFLEIDENMLKREISNMRRLRESDGISDFGGGEDKGDTFADESVKINALDEGSPVSALKLESALRKAIAENRKLKSNTKQYKNALQGMKQQLSEMNLFNAKLLYANKLMQNRDLSMKQQRHIVESLDEAGTLNEAKLLFESLSKSLSRPAKRSGNINESTTRRTLGSASRAVRSAQPVNEGVALDRWATLAGIKK